MWGCTIRYIKIYQYIEQYTEREREINYCSSYIYIYIYNIYIYIYIHIEREREINVCIYSFIPFGLEFSSSNWIWPSYQIHLPDGATFWKSLVVYVIGTVVTVVVVVIYDSYDYNPLENTRYCTVHSCELLYQHPKNTSLVISTWCSSHGVDVAVPMLPLDRG